MLLTAQLVLISPLRCIKGKRRNIWMLLDCLIMVTQSEIRLDGIRLPRRSTRCPWAAVGRTIGRRVPPRVDSTARWWCCPTWVSPRCRSGRHPPHYTANWPRPPFLNACWPPGQSPIWAQSQSAPRSSPRRGGIWRVVRWKSELYWGDGAGWRWVGRRRRCCWGGTIITACQ